MDRRIIISLLALLLAGQWQSEARQELPDYYTKYIAEKAAQIRHLQQNELDGFYFWTDSHFPLNCRNAAPMIEYLQAHSSPRKVFFGGDVVGGGIKELQTSKEMQTDAIEQISGNATGIYLIRGNHDFTTSTSAVALNRETDPQPETAAYIRKYTSADAIFNQEDSSSDYFYLDNPTAKIRYICFDTTDQVKDNRTIYGIADSQIEWVKTNAINTLPKGWSAVFFSHAPLAKDHTNFPSHVKAGELSNGVNTLMAICGHRHGDIESAIGEVFQVMTACDAQRDYTSFGMPITGKGAPKKNGTIHEQTFDYVSISKNKATISFLRLGEGHDRYFNIKPVQVKIRENHRFHSRLKGPLRWAAYDGEGNKVVKTNDRTKMLEPATNNAEIRTKAWLTKKAAGVSIVVACDPMGNKEFWIVI